MDTPLENPECPDAQSWEEEYVKDIEEESRPLQRFNEAHQVSPPPDQLESIAAFNIIGGAISDFFMFDLSHRLYRSPTI